MAAGRATRRLARLAEEAGAARAPYYVRRPVPLSLQPTFPAEGWYWVPPGHTFAVYLAGSELEAATKLIRIIEAQHRGAA